MEISPLLSAQLAAGVYVVQNEFQLKGFLSLTVFSTSSHQKTSINATVGSRLINTRDGFCVAARGGAGYEKDLFLMFRGSTTRNYGADWISNARCGAQFSMGGLVHVGFSHIFKSMRLDIDSFISLQKNDRKNPVQTIHCIGHSLGGAVATLAAEWVRRTTQKDVILYTFGAPKPGFEGFATSLTTRLGPQNVHRVYHATDPVPMVPLYPFAHPPQPGHGHYMGSADSILSAGAHDMAKYTQSVKGRNWKSMQSNPQTYGFSSAVEKWLESEKGPNPFAAETWVLMNAGLEYVLKKILGTGAVLLQGSFVGALSLADKIAWILDKGIDLTVDSGKWVLLLMRKMMQMLHMKVVATAKELTRALMRAVLERIMKKITQEAKKAFHLLTAG
jgi:hypothetical protein